MSTDHGLQPEFDDAARRLQAERYAERADELRQQDLLDPVTPEEMAAAKQEMGPGAGRLAVLAEARTRKRGRPLGATNRRNDDLVKYLLQYGSDPLVGAMIVQSTPTEVLMEQSGKSYLECLDRQIRCRELLAPYFHSKRPVGVDMTIRGVRVVEEIGGAAANDTIDGEFVRVVDPDGTLGELSEEAG